MHNIQHSVLNCMHACACMRACVLLFYYVQFFSFNVMAFVLQLEK